MNVGASSIEALLDRDAAGFIRPVGHLLPTADGNAILRSRQRRAMRAAEAETEMCDRAPRAWPQSINSTGWMAVSVSWPWEQNRWLDP